MVDEVDSMMIDKPKTKTMISFLSFFGLETAIFLSNIWSNLNVLMKSFKIEGIRFKRDRVEGMLLKKVGELVG